MQTSNSYDTWKVLNTILWNSFEHQIAPVGRNLTFFGQSYKTTTFGCSDWSRMHTKRYHRLSTRLCVNKGSSWKCPTAWLPASLLCMLQWRLSLWRWLKIWGSFSSWTHQTSKCDPSALQAIRRRHQPHGCWRKVMFLCCKMLLRWSFQEYGELRMIQNAGWSRGMEESKSCRNCICFFSRKSCWKEHIARKKKIFNHDTVPF